MDGENSFSWNYLKKQHRQRQGSFHELEINQGEQVLIDTHAHLLPGIDDGAKSLEESIALCRMAAADGIQALVCTPHVDFRYTNTRASIEPAFNLLEKAIKDEGVPLRLIKGAEVHMSPDILIRLKEKDLLTYADSGRYLLLEFPFQQVIMGTEDLVYRLRLAGVTPIIAHPERIGYFMDDPDRLFSLIRLGALGQVTGGSLLGQFGEKSQRVAITMVERHLVHIIASDAHDTSYRRPVLTEVSQSMERRFGQERARQMVEHNPRAVIEGKELDPPGPIEAPKRLKRFLGGIFGGRRGEK